MLIQRGLRRSNFYAGFWLNVAVGAVGLWAAVLLLVPREEWNWHAAPYFIASGVVGTAAGRLFRVAAIQKVGASVSAAILNLAPLISTVLAVVLLGERVTVAILTGTLVVVLGTILLSVSGRYVGFRPRDLIYPFASAMCFGVVAILRKLGLGLAGPLFDSAINITAALIASSARQLANATITTKTSLLIHAPLQSKTYAKNLCHSLIPPGKRGVPMRRANKASAPVRTVMFTDERAQQ